MMAAYGLYRLLRVTGSAFVRMIRSVVKRRREVATVTIESARLVAIATLILLLLPTMARAQQAPPPTAAEPDPGFTVKVKVDEVVLHATVRNRRGTPVAGLTKGDFQVFEDGVPQSIKFFSHEDVPVTVGLVVDNSGSMRTKRAEVIAAALAFADSSNPHDEMFLVNFNEVVSLGLPREVPFSDQIEELKAAMQSVNAAGKTALYDAVVLALGHLEKGSRDKKVLIVVSDGGDNASAHTKAQMLDLAIRSEAIVYVLGIYEPDDPENPEPGVLRALAKATGGEAFFPGTLSEVVPICKRIAHAIRNQYTIAYVPTNQLADAKYRAIQVRAKSSQGGDLTVVTRTGYVPRAKQMPPMAVASQPQAQN
jgi:VWFA-related protein